MQHHIICPKTGGLLFLSDFKNKDYEGLLRSSALYKIIYNRGNAINIYVDHKMITLKKEEVLFCKPLNTVQVTYQHEAVKVVAYNKDFYRLSNAEEEASFYWFWYFGVNHPHIFKLSEAEQDFFRMMYDSMEREFNQFNGCVDTVRELLKRLMDVSLIRVKGSPIIPAIGERQLHIIKKFSLLIEDHFRNKIAFADIPKLLKRNPPYLSKLLTKYFGKRAVKTAKEKFIQESKQAGARIEKRMEIQYPSRLNTLSEAEHQIQ
jgi:hypothetical protein